MVPASDPPKQHEVAIRSVKPVVGRGAKVRAAVLTATLAELTESGYAALTVERVARRSGVHKTTVYRRWADREALVVDAVSDLAAATVPLPDTGDVDADLTAYARALVALLTSATGRALLAVLTSDAARLPQIAQAKAQFLAARLALAGPRVAAAVAVGQLPADVDGRELAQAVIAPIYLRLLLTGEPVDDGTADQATRAALAAARAGLMGRSPLPGPSPTFTDHAPVPEPGPGPGPGVIRRARPDP